MNDINKLFNECIDELKSIGIDTSVENVGIIDIKISKKNLKRYGCCKQENPDVTGIKWKNGRRIYSKFKIHHIEISQWVMELDKFIIKNTIMHELIHCFPNCNNHGKCFKEYANYINKKLKYNISRVGNKEEDYSRSSVPYDKKESQFKYKIVCECCGQTLYRHRINKNFKRKYRCGRCGGTFNIHIN